jgi:hypothetical protein
LSQNEYILELPKKLKRFENTLMKIAGLTESDTMYWNQKGCRRRRKRRTKNENSRSRNLKSGKTRD